MRGETILSVETRVWRSLWRDGQQIMSRIAEQNRVFVFEPGRNPDRRHSEEMRRNWANFFALRPEKLHENLILVPTPSCLPYMSRHLPAGVLQVWTPTVARINARILIRHIRRTMQEFGVAAPILWLYDPRHIDLLGRCGEKLVCYYNYDELADFKHNQRIRGLFRQYDNRLSERADVVFATSRGQWARRKQLNEDTYFIPNGVDFDLYNSALREETVIPSDVAALPRPIIGLMGWLAYQVDVALLVRVAEAFPRCSLVLVGPNCLAEDEHRRALESLPNVHFVGQKELPSLPAYLKAFDVALIPYLIGGHTLTVYPLKLHEYLAAGRAIVATALPELLAFRPMVRVAETHDEFLRQVQVALDDDDERAVAMRVAVARESTWDRRVADIYRALQDKLSRSKGGRGEEDVHIVDALRSA